MTIRVVVRNVFLRFTSTLEGTVRCMYPDAKGIPTTDEGNALFTPAQACQIPWTVGDGGPLATQEQITAEWTMLNGNMRIAREGWRAAWAATSLRISPEVAAVLVIRRIDGMWGLLEQHFPNAPVVCADAQLGLASLGWANGSGFGDDFPKFRRAFLSGNFASYSTDPEPELLPGCCAYEGVDNPDAGGIHNAGIIPRNLDNRRLFEAAQRVVDLGLSFDELTGWP